MDMVHAVLTVKLKDKDPIISAVSRGFFSSLLSVSQDGGGQRIAQKCYHSWAHVGCVAARLRACDPLATLKH